MLYSSDNTALSCYFEETWYFLFLCSILCHTFRLDLNLDNMVEPWYLWNSFTEAISEHLGLYVWDNYLDTVWMCFDFHVFEQLFSSFLSEYLYKYIDTYYLFLWIILFLMKTNFPIAEAANIPKPLWLQFHVWQLTIDFLNWALSWTFYTQLFSHQTHI